MYVDLILLQKLFISLAIGLIVGFEREIAQEKMQSVKFAGLRTFGLAGLIGGISAYLTQHGYFIFVAMLLSVAVLLALAYYRSTAIDSHLGVTTELSLILTFLMGGLAYFEQTVAIIMAIIITVLLAFKAPLHEFTHKVPKEEFYDSLKFAIIALVILPVLPDQVYGPLGVFNPYQIWLIVVLISGISFAGYFLVKWFGPGAGMALTGIVGGIASSTAVTTTMAARTREMNGMEYEAMTTATLANTVMLLRVLLLVFIFYPALVYRIYLPIGVMSIIGLFIASYFYLKGSRNGANGAMMHLKSPFSIRPALTFGALITAILFVSKAASIYLGKYGLYATALFAGMADVDAIAISSSQLAFSGLAEPMVAVAAIMLAVFVNLGIRTVYAYYFGTRGFGRYTIFMAVAMIVPGLLMILLLL